MATRLRRHRKFRGLRTHGRGKKAGRGKGKRGGTGMAGLHKHKWIWTLKYDPDHFGRHGFKRPSKMLGAPTTINVKELATLKPGDFVKVSKEQTSIDLVQLGIDKLLGGGKCKAKYEITVDYASAQAVEKVKAAGGKITVNIVPEPKKPKADKSAPKGGKEAKGAPAPKAPGQKPQKDTANIKTPKVNAPSGGKGSDKGQPKPEKKL